MMAPRLRLRPAAQHARLNALSSIFSARVRRAGLAISYIGLGAFTHRSASTAAALQISSLSWLIVGLIFAVWIAKIHPPNDSKPTPWRWTVAAAGLWILSNICQRAALDPVGMLWPRAFMPVCMAFMWSLLPASTRSNRSSIPHGTSKKEGGEDVPLLLPADRSMLAFIVATAAVALGGSFILPPVMVLAFCSMLFSAAALLTIWSRMGLSDHDQDSRFSVSPTGEHSFHHLFNYSPQTDRFHRDFSIVAATGSGLSALFMESLFRSSVGAGSIYLPFGFAFRISGGGWYITTLVATCLHNLATLLVIRNHGPLGLSVLIVMASLLANPMAGVSGWTFWFSCLSIASATIFSSSHPTLTGLTGDASVTAPRPGWNRALRRSVLWLLFLISLGGYLLKSPPGGWSRTVSLKKLESGPDVIQTADYTPASFASNAVHPVVQLMDQATLHFERTKKRQSKTLAEAVVEYRRRYGIHPPPLFDKWYEFASRGGYVMIDEFDNIFHDLKPFWGVAPKTIRARALEGISGQDNALGGVFIRNGQLVRSGGGEDWFWDALGGMMSPFARLLPDMNLAFNIHDEPRVVVAHTRLSRFIERAESGDLGKAAAHADPTNRFSARPDDVNEKAGSIPYFGLTSFNRFPHQHTWAQSRQSCGPDTPAQQVDDVLTDNRTAYAVTPLGFIYNHTALEDICLSPSLATSYGFFDSPNAFNIVQDLFPIFSQSKVSSYQDILFPSPWNWAERVKYDETDDVEWEEKSPRLYWRGSTTGGFSRDESWRRHHRQRTVAKMNGLDEFSQANPRSNVVLLSKHNDSSNTTDDGSDTDWRPRNGSLSSHSGLFDVRFSHVGQCDPTDCASQIRFFAVGDRVSRTDAYRSRFVLDLDGNAFSGRFYAFVKSRSVVLKQSIFKEWHSGGTYLVPWLHYVPISIDGMEWVELMRFLVSDPVGRERAVAMARAQTEWAEKALRKRDMEVYLFRLMLEYARLVDDDRTTIGYLGP